MNTGLLTVTHEQAVMKDEAGYGIIASFGDVMKEYAAIRSSVGIFDMSTHGKFRVSGDEHVAWVSKMVSRDIEFLNSETEIFALCLDEEAKLLGIVTLYKYDDAIVIETETTDRKRLTEWFEQHREEGVEIEDISDEYALIGLEGPLAFKVAQTLLDYEISSIPFQGFVEVERDGATLLLARTGYTGEYGYKVFVPASVAGEVWHELYAKTQELGGTQCGSEALEITMLEVRQPIGHIEAREIPVLEAGLGWLIDFGKMDAYIGQEAINEQAAQPVERRMIGFIVEKQAQIEAGDAIVLDDQVIGRVVTACYSPTLDAILGLALNNEPFTVPGLTWTVRTAEGTEYAAESASSPYIVPRSWKVKML
ncbi:aminomethyltransferase [Thermosporothrix hazakensis]|jgi:aminomethyltransferase|uniref:Aminomethyltransferase n=2 Tax=Thermosporothrix TaxID=768650 RepID=A0A326U8I6_THEHA|nr:aminomethyltransferase family protein [Thermosporothrix hazakensis]PZW22847.1 aminomethyltransferase [Thermosporothrix hazakensis]BBH91672.1 aminomethyltransferase [Thermosporothrix sp. COM3]GCE49814.1 aminomethyltransferase [Thermosporothrix hazakensis]